MDNDKVIVNLTVVDNRILIAFEVENTGEELLALVLSPGATLGLAIRLLTQVQSASGAQDAPTPPAGGRYQ